MQNNLALPPDYRERELALDPGRSFICEAPAGSGKTELLTQRFLTLLSRVEQPEEILAITFTRKATGEMRERILKALQDGKGSAPESSHKQVTWKLARAVLAADHEHQWQLLENPSRLRIQTFDSLCSSLTRQLPLESSLGAQPQIQDDSSDLYRSAVRALLGTLEDDTPWAASLSNILGLLDNRFEKFESLMMDMLARRDSWLPILLAKSSTQDIRQTLEDNFCSVISEKIAAVREKIPTHCHKDIINLASYAAANIRIHFYQSDILNCIDMDLLFNQLPESKPENLPIWLGISELFTTSTGSWRKMVTVKTGFPPGKNREEKDLSKDKKQQWNNLLDILAQRDGLQDDFKNLCNLPTPTLDTEQWKILQALFELLPVLVAQLTLIFREQNTVDFVELGLAARRALGDLDTPSNLALRMDYRLRHILVDEFQDTSLSQIELLNRLTQGWEVGDGRTLFCVGDAMQSVYAFRGANVGLFLHCREQGLAHVLLESIRLQANFRSQAGIVDWINRVFSSSFPQQNDISSGAVKYSPSTAIHAKEEDEAVYVHTFVDHDTNYQEAQNILDTIRKTQLNTPDASIAVLVRSRDHASHILPLLKRNGVRYRAVDLEPLQNHAVIQDLLALTRALLHPADRTAWLAILRAPWCGLSLADLDAIANFIKPEIQGEPEILRESEIQTEPELQIPEESKSEQITQPGNRKFRWPTLLEQAQASLALSLEKNRVNDIDNIRQSDLFTPKSIPLYVNQTFAISEEGQKSLQRVLPILQSAVEQRDRKTFRQWIQGCWILLAGPAAVESETALHNAEVYFDLLEKWEYASSLPSFDLLMRHVEKLYAQADVSADDRLQIMSIHKSKGLEFDVVIVPSLHRKSGTDDLPVLLWQQRLNNKGQPELLMAPLTGGKTKHVSYNYLREEEKKKTLLENCRLLYVAATRARKKLYLSALVERDPNDQFLLRPPTPHSLLSNIWDAVKNLVSRVEKPINDANKIPLQDVNEKTFIPRSVYRIAKEWQPCDLAEVHSLSAFIPEFDYQNESNKINLELTNATPRHVGTVVHRYLQAFAETGLNSWSEYRIHQYKNRIEQALKILGVHIRRLPIAIERVTTILCKILQDPKASTIFATDYAFSGNEFAVTLKTNSGTTNLIIDRVYQDSEGTLWIIDYKTSEPEEDQTLEEFLLQEINAYQQQLGLYKRAMQGLGYQKIKTALYFPAVCVLREFEMNNF